MTAIRKLIAVDIETTGLSPFNDEILLVQLGTPELQLIIDFRQCTDLDPLRELLEDVGVKKLGFNLQFDFAFLEQRGFKVRGPIIDVWLCAKVLTTGEPEGRISLSMAALSESWLGKRMENKPELQKSFIGHTGDFKFDQLEYAAQDVVIPFLLYSVAKVLLKKAELVHVAQLECRALPIITQMYVNGFKLNIPYYKQILKEDLEYKEVKKVEVIEYLDKRSLLENYKCPLTKRLLIHPDYSGKGKNKTKGFNVGSPSQLGNVLAASGVPLTKKVDSKTEKVSYSCDKNILAFYHDDYEVLQIYKAYKQASVACSYSEKLITIAEDSADKRIHCRYNQLVRTGRLSAMQPNLQQIKKGPRYRTGFIAEVGYVLVIADYSQLEIRLVAEVSGDENLIDIYAKGLDVHTASASLMTGVPLEEVTKEARQAAKVFNFACLYGAGALTVRKQAVSMFGLMWSLDEVKEKLAQWKAAYPGVLSWQKSQGSNEQLEVFTKFGRRRLLQTPKKDESNYTTNLNTPIQGLGADVMKAAMALLWERHLMYDDEIKVVACVHDELILEAPAERQEQAMGWLKSCMEDAAPLIGITKVPIIADAGCGTDWSAK